MIKYPRTYHLPWSPGCTQDDKKLSSVSSFLGKNVVVTEKLDGENCTITKEGIYARSIDSNGGVLRQRVKAYASTFQFDIPDGYRICGENMQWQHSIRYENLVVPFYAFSVWNNNNVCLSWNDTLDFLALLNLTTPPLLYRGVFDFATIKQINVSKIEGYVVRLEDSFAFDDFSESVAKYVRANHVQTDQHWSSNLKENGFLS